MRRCSPFPTKSHRISWLSRLKRAKQEKSTSEEQTLNKLLQEISKLSPTSTLFLFFKAIGGFGLIVSIALRVWTDTSESLTTVQGWYLYQVELLPLRAKQLTFTRNAAESIFGIWAPSQWRDQRLYITQEVGHEGRLCFVIYQLLSTLFTHYLHVLCQSVWVLRVSWSRKNKYINKITRIKGLKQLHLHL